MFTKMPPTDKTYLWVSLGACALLTRRWVMSRDQRFEGPRARVGWRGAVSRPLFANVWLLLCWVPGSGICQRYSCLIREVEHLTHAVRAAATVPPSLWRRCQTARGKRVSHPRVVCACAEGERYDAIVSATFKDPLHYPTELTNPEHACINRVGHPFEVQFWEMTSCPVVRGCLRSGQMGRQSIRAYCGPNRPSVLNIMFCPSGTDPTFPPVLPFPLFAFPKQTRFCVIFPQL